MAYGLVALKNGRIVRMSLEEYKKYMEEERSGKKKTKPKKLEIPKERKLRPVELEQPESKAVEHVIDVPNSDNQELDYQPERDSTQNEE